MKIKINWGTGIIIVIALFLISVFVRIYISYQHDINLVTPDYYPQELKYEQHIQKEANTSHLAEKIIINYTEKEITVTFPRIINNKDIKGEIVFYRPSDYQYDLSYAILLDDKRQQVFSTDSMINGKYIVQIDWRMDTLELYQEEEIVITK